MAIIRKVTFAPRRTWYYELKARGIKYPRIYRFQIVATKRSEVLLPWFKPDPPENPKHYILIPQVVRFLEYMRAVSHKNPFYRFLITTLVKMGSLKAQGPLNVTTVRFFSPRGGWYAKTVPLFSEDGKKLLFAKGINLRKVREAEVWGTFWINADIVGIIEAFIREHVIGKDGARGLFHSRPKARLMAHIHDIKIEPRARPFVQGITAKRITNAEVRQIADELKDLFGAILQGQIQGYGPDNFPDLVRRYMSQKDYAVDEKRVAAVIALLERGMAENPGNTRLSYSQAKLMQAIKRYTVRVPGGE